MKLRSSRSGTVARGDNTTKYRARYQLSLPLSDFAADDMLEEDAEGKTRKSIARAWQRYCGILHNRGIFV
jgi:hypothetical protein